MKIRLTFQVDDNVHTHELVNQIQQDLSKTDDWFDVMIVGQEVVDERPVRKQCSHPEYKTTGWCYTISCPDYVNKHRQEG